MTNPASILIDQRLHDRADIESADTKEIAMSIEENAVESKSQAGKETGASAAEKTGCCGGPPPEGTDACCSLDATVKSKGGAGCGCGTSAKKSCC